MQKKKICIIIIICISILIILTYLKDNSTINTYITNTNALIEDTNYFNIYNSIDTYEEEYTLILELPSINLYTGAYDINSIYNDVSYGLEVLSDSTYPNEDNSITIIASHSGNSNVSYFKDLKFLEYNDIANIYYEDKLYTYFLKDIIYVDKTGTIDLNINFNNKTLILITCIENTDKQYVFIFYMQDY